LQCARKRQNKNGANNKSRHWSNNYSTSRRCDVAIIASSDGRCFTVVPLDSPFDRLPQLPNRFRRQRIIVFRYAQSEPDRTDMGLPVDDEWQRQRPE
jgi:hypothetical protein